MCGSSVTVSLASAQMHRRVTRRWSSCVFTSNYHCLWASIFLRLVLRARRRHHARVRVLPSLRRRRACGVAAEAAERGGGGRVGELPARRRGVSGVPPPPRTTRPPTKRAGACRRSRSALQSAGGRPRPRSPAAGRAPRRLARRGCPSARAPCCYAGACPVSCT